MKTKDFVYLVSIPFIALLIWFWFDHQWKRAEFIVQVRHEDKEFNYRFQPTDVFNGSFRFNEIVKCNLEYPVIVLLIKDGIPIRRLSYCPSEVTVTNVGQEGN